MPDQVIRPTSSGQSARGMNTTAVRCSIARKRGLGTLLILRKAAEGGVGGGVILACIKRGGHVMVARKPIVYYAS